LNTGLRNNTRKNKLQIKVFIRIDLPFRINRPCTTCIKRTVTCQHLSRLNALSMFLLKEYITCMYWIISIFHVFLKKCIPRASCSIGGEVTRIFPSTPGTHNKNFIMHILFQLFIWCIKQYTDSANYFFIVKRERSDVSFNTITTS